MKVRRALVNIFIVLCVWGQLGFLLHVPPLGRLSGSWLNENVKTAPIQFIAAGLIKSSEIMYFFGRRIPFHFDWTLFTPTVVYRWKNSYKAIYDDGSEYLLPLPNQAGRSFLERHFFDFSEVMFQVNLHVFGAHRHYAEYLCRRYGNERRIDRIRITSHLREMYSPWRAQELGRFVSPNESENVEGEIPCAR